MFFKKIGAAAVAAMALSANASAAVVFENGTDGNFWAGNNPFTYQLVTNDFSLSNSATITSLTYNAFTTNATVPVTNVLVDFFAAAGSAKMMFHRGRRGVEHFGAICV